MADLQGLIDMNYFWWVFNKVLSFGVPFLVIFIAITCGGLVLYTIISAFKKMRS